MRGVDIDQIEQYYRFPPVQWNETKVEQAQTRVFRHDSHENLFLPRHDHITSFTYENELEKIIYNYLCKYKNLGVGKEEYTFIFGVVSFIKLSKNDNSINVYDIYIKPQFRRRGITTNFLKKLINSTDRIVKIEAVISMDMVYFLNDFTHQNKKFKKIKGIYTFNSESI